MIKTSDGKEYLTDYTILCTGNTENTNFKELEGCPGYYPYFYRHEKEFVDAVQTTQKDSRVLIIGSRLAAIDASSILEADGYSGQLTLTSLYGMLPNVRDEFIKPKSMAYFDREKLIKSGIRFTPDIFEEHFNAELSIVFEKEGVKWQELVKPIESG